MKVIRKTILSILIITSYLVNAQTPVQQFNNFKESFPNVPISPTASKFKQYGDIENNEYTGTNCPKIDLYDLKIGRINLPLSLNYVSGNGVKVADEASNVGLGWEIPLPTISQNIYGYDDFESGRVKFRFDFVASNFPYLNSFPNTTQGWLNNPTGYNYSPNFDTFAYYKATNYILPIDGHFSNSLSSPNFGATDAEPDIFIANILGDRIEFKIENFPTTQSINYTNINNPVFKILNNTTAYNIQYINNGFVILDPNGTKYYFNLKEDVKHILNTVSSRKFVLTKIRDCNGEEVNFLYDNIPLVYNIPISGGFNTNITTSSTQQNFYLGGIGTVNIYCCDFVSSNNGGLPTNTAYGSNQNILNIKEINGRFGKITFDLSDRIDYPSKKIDKINVYDFNNKSIKDVDFYYDYFNSNLNTNSYTIAFVYTSPPSVERLTKRLKLNGIKFNNTEEYQFEYNETLLPAKISYATDYWGYSNGGDSNLSFMLNPNDFNIPSIDPLAQYQATHSTFNTKTANINFAQSAILKKIIYPTKGSSEFFYENNISNNLFYSGQNFKWNYGNGVRLNSQVNYKESNVFSSKTQFEYVNGVTITPLLLYTNTLNNIINYMDLYACPPNDDAFVTYTTYSGNTKVFKDNMIPTHALASHVTIGYDKVIKKDLDENGISKGRIETEYSNNENLIHPYIGLEGLNILPAVKGDNIENGNVTKTTIYNNSNTKLKEITNSYYTENSSFDYGITIADGVRKHYSFNSPGGCGFFTPFTDNISYIGYYPIYSSKTKLFETITKEYFSGNEMMKRENFSYNYWGELDSKTVVYPNNDLIGEYYSYFTYPDLLSIQNRYRDLTMDQTYKELDYNPITGEIGIETYPLTKMINYKQDTTTHNLVLPSSIYVSKEMTSINDLEKKINFDLYDDKGNLLQITEKEYQKTSYIWGYNKMYVIAKLENLEFSSIPESTITSLQNLSNSDTDNNFESLLRTALNNLRANYPNAMISTYTYDPLIGVTSMTDSKGDTQTFTYDSMGRLQNVKDKDANILSENEYHYKPQN